jgi:hypothetical protein
MNTAICLSVNENPDYLFYKPIVEAAWEALGFDVYTSVIPLEAGPSKSQHDIRRSVTLSQVQRMFLAKELDDYDLCVTSDIDLIPLNKDYFKSAFAKKQRTIIGYDITGYTQVPMSYIAQTPLQWKACLEPYKTADELYDKEFDSKSTWEAEWCFDQIFITERLKVCGGLTTANMIDRVAGGKHFGRVDRSDWHNTKGMGNWIDAHLLRDFWKPESWKQICELLLAIGAYSPWMDDYYKNFMSTHYPHLPQP